MEGRGGGQFNAKVLVKAIMAAKPYHQTVNKPPKTAGRKRVTQPGKKGPHGASFLSDLASGLGEFLCR